MKYNINEMNKKILKTESETEPAQSAFYSITITLNTTLRLFKAYNYLLFSNQRQRKELLLLWNREAQNHLKSF